MQQEKAGNNNGVRVSRLSSLPLSPCRAIAVFAYNEAGRICTALESIAAAGDQSNIEVLVLANGCRDTTIEEVRACVSFIPNLTLVEIDLADKANAWNLFVHDLFTPERALDIETYFFMDGDVRLEPDALDLLASSFDDAPTAKAAGGMPTTGRDRDAWRERMVLNEMLSGNLYALRGSFVRQLRERQVRMPVGLIGEDFFASWLVASELGRRDGPVESTQCVFHTGAQFSFRSLSPLRLKDYRTYWRRKWRYTFRDLQHQMLILHLFHHGLSAIPGDVEELYCVAPLPSRLRWVGLDTPLRLMAMIHIRSVRKKIRNDKRLGNDS